MIQPIRAIDGSVPSVARMLHALWGPGLWRCLGAAPFWIPWIRLPLALRLHRPLLDTLAASLIEGRPPPARWQVVPEKLPPFKPPKAHDWQAWYEYAPFVDRVTRWWPSDELPPLPPPPAPEAALADRPIEVVEWVNRGMLLDAWV